jgi:hypothetical protein
MEKLDPIIVDDHRATIEREQAFSEDAATAQKELVCRAVDPILRLKDSHCITLRLYS